MLWHQFTGLFLSASTFLIPLFVGRVLIFEIDVRLLPLLSLDAPIDYKTRELASKRYDLLCHDIYAYMLGSFVLFLLYMPIRLVASIFRFGVTKLRRRNAVRRQSHAQPTFEELLEYEDDVYRDDRLPLLVRARLSIVTWWLTKGRRFLKKTIAFLSLGFWGILLIPILMGLAFEIYVLHPLGVPEGSRQLYFILNEWTFGILLLKLFCSIILVGPDSFVKRELNQVFTRGLGMDIVGFYLRLVVPALGLVSSILIVPKTMMRVLDTLEAKDSGDTLTLYVQYLLAFALLGSLIYGFLYRAFDRLAQSIRDEEFRIGRTLHNFEDVSAANTIEPLADFVEPLGN